MTKFKKLFNFFTKDKYIRKIKVEKITDWDTIEVMIDLWLWIYHREVLRFERINAYEKRWKEKALGLLAKKFVEKMLNWKEVYIKTRKAKNWDDKRWKYGRLLAEIIVDWKNLNDELVENWLAIYTKY